MNYLFESKHLLFRCFGIQDAEDLYNNHMESEMKQWIPNESYADIKESKSAITFYRDCVNNNRFPYVLAIIEKASGNLIGDTGVNPVKGNKNEVEIGYSICKSYTGKGYATEAVEAMSNYIAEKFDPKALYGRVLNGNHASVRVLEKAGYTYINEELCAEDDPYNKGMLVFKRKI